MLDIFFKQEEDGRWFAEIPEIPGLLICGATLKEAKEKVKILALHILADRLENGESLPVTENSL